jgi:hypothetical protein
MRREDLTGNKYGRLTVVEFSHYSKGHSHWKCLCDCGNTIITRADGLKNGHGKSCGCLQKERSGASARTRSGENHPSWKKGIHHSCGYIKVKCKGHPRADMWGYVAEHVLVAERALGEYIPKHHVIHHINGDRADNRLENLMWFPNNSEHMKFHRRQENK